MQGRGELGRNRPQNELTQNGSLHRSMSTKKPAKSKAKQPDFLAEIMAKRTAQNPDFPKLVEEAKKARKARKKR